MLEGLVGKAPPLRRSCSVKKTFYKALTYKLMSLAITIVVSAILTGSVVAALGLGLADGVFKMGLYMANETAWEKLSKSSVAATAVAMALAVAEMLKGEATTEGAFVKGSA